MKIKSTVLHILAADFLRRVCGVAQGFLQVE
nr:MAG TPA: hypothetical protein [Caudoviricetes sp.]